MKTRLFPLGLVILVIFTSCGVVQPKKNDVQIDANHSITAFGDVNNFVICNNSIQGNPLSDGDVEKLLPGSNGIEHIGGYCRYSNGKTVVSLLVRNEPGGYSLPGNQILPFILIINSDGSLFKAMQGKGDTGRACTPIFIKQQTITLKCIDETGRTYLSSFDLALSKEAPLSSDIDELCEKANCWGN